MRHDLATSTLLFVAGLDGAPHMLSQINKRASNLMNGCIFIAFITAEAIRGALPSAAFQGPVNSLMLAFAGLSTVAATRTVSNMASNSTTRPSAICVKRAGEAAVNSVFQPRDPNLVPAGFKRTCDEMGW